ncbi:hypothetical protein AGIG_G24190 [Arapaima gigas]
MFRINIKPGFPKRRNLEQAILRFPTDGFSQCNNGGVIPQGWATWLSQVCACGSKGPRVSGPHCYLLR